MQNLIVKSNGVKKKLSFAIKFVSFSLLFASPLIALASDEVSRGLSNVGGLFGGGFFSSSDTIGDLIYKIIELLLFVAGILAVLFIIIGGYQYITSAGNEEQAEKGRKTLVNAIIGVALIILSYVIINVLVNTISNYF